MSFIWLLCIICVVAIIPFIIWIVKSGGDSVVAACLIVLFGFGIFIFLFIGLIQPMSLRKENIRQTKERQQIEYQIENLTSESDKIKLNEWILTYNDWVNDVNSDKELWGYWSWYYIFDMTEHTIILLV